MLSSPKELGGPAWIGWHLAAPAKAVLLWQSVSIYWLDVKNLENNFLTQLSPVACNHSAGAFNSPASSPSLSKFLYRGRKRPLWSIRCLHGRKAKLREHWRGEANEEGLTEDSVSCFLWCIDVTQQGRTSSWQLKQEQWGRTLGQKLLCPTCFLIHFKIPSDW